MTFKEKRPQIVEHQDRNTPRTAGEQHLLDALRDAPLGGWTVYEQPHLNGDRPDFVLVHPDHGVVLIEVKDYDLSTGRYAWQGGRFCFLGNDDRWHPKRNPADQVKDVRDNILELYSSKFLALESTFGEEAWGVLETVVYFHHASAETARQLCGSPKNVRFVGHDQIQSIREGRLGDSGISALIYSSRPSKFTAGGLLQAFTADLESWLHPAAYMKERRLPISLTTEQARNASPAPRIHRRLRGAAGSGKSVVLASRAAALLAQGKRVLLLTYNITLMHYLRDLVAQQTAKEDWPAMREGLVVLHYHGLLKWFANKHNIALARISDHLTSEERDRILNEEHPREVNEEIVRCLATGRLKPDAVFDAILIDEAQDFEREWIRGLLPLLNQNDEMLLAYDSLQNLYQRDLVWIENDNRGMGFSGKPAELKKSQRLPRPFAEAAGAFVQRFINPDFKQVESDLPAQTLYKHRLEWKNLTTDAQHQLPEIVYADIQHLTGHQNFQAHFHDISIITDGHEQALPIIQKLLAENLEVTHVFDLSGDKDFRQRRRQKWRFQPGDGQIRVCSLHSFKGWESPYVILLLSPRVQQREERAYQAYVALTRVKTQADGASSALLVYNLDSNLNDAAQIVNHIDQGQTGVYVPRQRGT